jgi:hypothetical protein
MNTKLLKGAPMALVLSGGLATFARAEVRSTSPATAFPQPNI